MSRRPFEPLTRNQLSDFKKNLESKARFSVDETVGIEAAKLIRDRGWDVRYVDEVGLLERSNDEVLAFAWNKQRILLTNDFAFLDDSRFPFQRNPGLLVMPAASDSAFTDAINAVLALLEPEKLSEEDRKKLLEELAKAIMGNQ